MPSASFVHIGDVHLHDGPRQADRLRALGQIIREGRTLPDLGAWLIPGDLFHARSSIASRNALAEILAMMVAVAPVEIVPGNHDVPGDLDIYSLLGGQYPVHVYRTPCVETFVLAGAGRQRASVFALPYPTTAGLLAENYALPDIPAAARGALEALFIQAGDQLRRARDEGQITLCIGHANVDGAIMSTGQPVIGAEISVDQALLAHLPEDCYIGLNHIHKAQDVGRATYAGSICRLNWGEIEPKSYVVARYNLAAGGLLWALSPPERRPIDVAPLYHVEARLTRAGIEDLRVTNGPEGGVMEMPPTWDGCEIRLRATYLQSEGLVLQDAQAQARRLFTGAVRFEFEPVCVKDHALRAPEVAGAATLPEKVAAWARVVGTTLPADVATKLEQLEATDPDLVVAAVETKLTWEMALV